LATHAFSCCCWLIYRRGLCLLRQASKLKPSSVDPIDSYSSILSTFFLLTASFQAQAGSFLLLSVSILSTFFFCTCRPSDRFLFFTGELPSSSRIVNPIDGLIPVVVIQHTDPFFKPLHRLALETLIVLRRFGIDNTLLLTFGYFVPSFRLIGIDQYRSPFFHRSSVFTLSTRSIGIDPIIDHPPFFMDYLSPGTMSLHWFDIVAFFSGDNFY